LAIRLNLETGGKLHTVEIKSPGGPTHRRWIVSVQNETHTREHPIDLMAHSGNRMVFSINNRIFDLIVEPVANSSLSRLRRMNTVWTGETPLKKSG